MLVDVDNLSKEYKMKSKKSNSFFKRDSKPEEVARKIALDNISFSIDKGEIVGILGPNGAGKTTLLKILSGLLYPDSGKVSVAGHNPFNRENAFLKNIGFVAGTKHNLLPDITPRDYLRFLRSIYRISERDYENNLAEIDDIFKIQDLLDKQTRRLSLGQRMKCEIAASLIHKPSVLFLDEPTIGLDITSQSNLRDFLKQYNSTNGNTILITSHYINDIAHLTNRGIIIDKGKIIYDNDLSGIGEFFDINKRITIKSETNLLKLVPKIEETVEIIENKQNQIIFKANESDIPEIIQKINDEMVVYDISIDNLPIEDVILELFRSLSA